MNFYLAFIKVNNYESIRPILMDFKEKMKGQGEFVVVNTLEENYDFLLNSMMEKSRAEEKMRGRK